MSAALVLAFVWHRRSVRRGWCYGRDLYVARELMRRLGEFGGSGG